MCAATSRLPRVRLAALATALPRQMALKLRIALCSILTIAALGAIAPMAHSKPYIYWSSGNAIGRADLNGANADQTFISGASGPDDVALSASDVYWANFSNGTIGRSSREGTGTNQSLITGAASPYGVATDSNYVYWTDWANGTINRRNLDGSGVTEPLITGLTYPSGIAVDSNYIYWSEELSNRISRANLDGSSPSNTFITGLSRPTGIAVDSEYIYWAGSTFSGAIGRAKLNGTEPDSGFITGLLQPMGVDVNPPYIYWAEYYTSSIGRAGIDGTNPDSSFITGISTSRDVAVDQSAGSFSPSTYDFGSVKASGGEKAKTFTLSSSGNAPLIIGGSSIGGGDGGSFGILGGSCLAGSVSLAKGESCTVSVNFAPDGIGSKAASFDLATNVGVKSAALSGKGVGTPTMISVRAAKSSLKVKVGCGDGGSCSLRLTGKKVGSRAAVKPKTVAVNAGQKPTVTVSYSKGLKKALAKGGRVSVTATRLNAVGSAKTITLRVRK